MTFRSSRHLMAAIAFAAITCPIILVPGGSVAFAQTTESRTSVQDVLRATFASADSGVLRPADRDVLNSFYQARDYQPIWVDDMGPTRAAQLVLNELNEAASWGLTAADFALSANRVPRVDGHWTAQQTVVSEIEISEAIITYALQARGGRMAEPDRMLSTYLDRRPNLPNAADVLASVAASDHPDALLLSYHPQHPQFQKLREAYAALAEAGNGKPSAIVPKTGEMILPGDAHPDVIALRIRLKVPATGGNASIYDPALSLPLSAFSKLLA